MLLTIAGVVLEQHAGGDNDNSQRSVRQTSSFHYVTIRVFWADVIQLAIIMITFLATFAISLRYIVLKIQTQ